MEKRSNRYRKSILDSYNLANKYSRVPQNLDTSYVSATYADLANMCISLSVPSDFHSTAGKCAGPT